MKKQEEIKDLDELIQKNYVVIGSGEGYVTLRAPKKFNWTAFVFLVIFLNIFGLAGYLMYYSMKKGKEITVSTGEK